MGSLEIRSSSRRSKSNKGEALTPEDVLGLDDYLLWKLNRPACKKKRRGRHG